MRYLVTGGAGFIGSNIVRTLLEQNHSVVVLDNFYSGKKENLENILSEIQLIEGSILDLPLLQEIIPSIDIIIHQAAIPSVPVSIEQPLESHQSNTTGTLNLLETARQNKIKRFVYASSSSIYGDSPTLPKIESMIPNPLSPYAVNKICGEYYCKSFSALHKLETVCLRYFNVFGPYQNPYSEYSAVIPKFIHAFLENKSPIIFGDGTQSRDFTYIQNVVDANILAANAPGQFFGEVFNLAGGTDAITLNQLVEKLQKIMGSTLPPEYRPARLGDVKHSLAEVSAIHTKLGFKNSVPFDEGLEKTVDWFSALASSQK